MKTPRRKAVRPGHVYVLYDPFRGLFKIGSSINVMSRMMQLSQHAVNAFRLVTVVSTSDVFKTEYATHDYYKHRRVHGEWFALTYSDVEEILSVKNDSEKNTIQWLLGIKRISSAYPSIEPIGETTRQNVPRGTLPRLTPAHE